MVLGDREISAECFYLMSLFFYFDSYVFEVVFVYSMVMFVVVPFPVPSMMTVVMLWFLCWGGGTR